MVGFTLRKEERDAGGMPGLVAAAGATSTYSNLNGLWCLSKYLHRLACCVDRPLHVPLRHS